MVIFIALNRTNRIARARTSIIAVLAVMLLIGAALDIVATIQANVSHNLLETIHVLNHLESGLPCVKGYTQQHPIAWSIIKITVETT